MSYSTMLQSLPAPLRSLLHEPTYIAAIASVGVHGLLWVVLPHLPLSAGQPTEAEIQRQVGLVELTPEELARVPQFDAQTNLPIPNAPLPPADAGRLPQEFSITPLPSSPPLVLPPSFYIPPPAPAARSPIFIPQTPTRPQSNTPTTRTIPAPIPTPSRSPAATPTPTPSPIPRIEQPDTSGTGAIAQAPALDRLRRPNPNNTPSTSPSPNSEGNSGEQTDEPGSQPSPTATPSPTETSSPQPQDLVAANREERDRVRRLITPYPTGSVPRSSGDSNVAFTDWFYEGREGRELEDLLKESITARYPREACQLRRSETVIYGVDVNADDRIVGDPQLLFSSGYPVFDEVALDAVRRHNFNNTTSEEQPYQATVTFEYSRDVCPSGSPSDIPAG